MEERRTEERIPTLAELIARLQAEVATLRAELVALQANNEEDDN